MNDVGKGEGEKGDSCCLLNETAICAGGQPGLLHGSMSLPAPQLTSQISCAAPLPKTTSAGLIAPTSQPASTQIPPMQGENQAVGTVSVQQQQQSYPIQDQSAVLPMIQHQPTPKVSSTVIPMSVPVQAVPNMNLHPKLIV